MDILEIQKEVSFIKSRINKLDELLRLSIIDKKSLEKSDTSIRSFFDNNIEDWVVKNYIKVSDLKNSFKNFTGLEVTTIKLNRELKSYCAAKDIIIETDKAKRIGSNVTKCYFFFK